MSDVSEFSRYILQPWSGRPQVVSGDFEIRRPETAAETLSKIIKAHVN